jgi:Plasmid pRiA4b ORF-3-like protein
MAIARKAPLRAVKVAAPIYQLRIELLDVSPVIWRRVLVPGSIKLHKLHAVLLWTMGWAGGHLHEFVIGHGHYGEPDPDFDTPPRVQRDDRFTLATALGARKSFIYLYDFGDGWEHRVTVEKALPADPALKCQRRLKSDPLCGEIVERNLTHLDTL